MWQHFTEGAKNAVIRAQKVAISRSENLVKTEHLLIGLVSENHTDAYRLLREAGVEVGDLIGHLEAILTPGPGRDGTNLRLDPTAKRVIDLAWNEARLLRRNYIGTEHLILGILAADSGATGITFRHFSLDLEKGRSIADSVENFYPDVPTVSAGSGLASAVRPSEPDVQEIVRRRSSLLPGIFFGIAFTIVIMMMRGCGQ